MTDATVEIVVDGSISESEVKSLIFQGNSGLAERESNASDKSSLKVDYGLFCQFATVVISAATAAKTLYELSHLIKAHRADREKASSAPKSQEIDQTQEKPRLKIIIDGVAYQIDGASIQSIERILKDG